MRDSWPLFWEMFRNPKNYVHRCGNPLDPSSQKGDPLKFITVLFLIAYQPYLL